jgi:molybdate transport system permease protein
MTATNDEALSPPTPRARPRSDAPFLVGLSLIGGLYVVLIAAMLWADANYTSPGHLLNALTGDEGSAIRYAIRLSLISCTITTILALWVAVPLGYLLSRWDGLLEGVRIGAGMGGLLWVIRIAIEMIVDVPIVLPPLVVGLSLLLLMQTAVGKWFESHIFGVTFAIPAIILAQFAVAAAFAVRIMRVTFDQITPRSEQVALTLGCSRSQAFWRVALPEARRGLLGAATLSWARSLGEFGPVLIFAGATRHKTEVLSTSIFLELSIGNVEAAVAVSLLMLAIAVLAIAVMRVAGSADLLRGTVRL